ncbi:hypothetical protein SALBM217S_09689 [Streptomyces griseoloalbus]
MRCRTLSPPSPMKTLRFCRERTPTMNSAVMVRVRQPSSSNRLNSTASA